jgi:hypothetical protein
MILNPRKLASVLERAAHHYPALVVTGPRREDDPVSSDISQSQVHPAGRPRHSGAGAERSPRVSGGAAPAGYLRRNPECPRAIRLGTAPNGDRRMLPVNVFPAQTKGFADAQAPSRSGNRPSNNNGRVHRLFRCIGRRKLQPRYDVHKLTCHPLRHKLRTCFTRMSAQFRR